jgi:hypothetical protein
VALVNSDSILRTLMQRLAKLQPPQGVELLSYKRNRAIGVLLQEGGRFLVRERGYREEARIVNGEELQKHLKALIKYEFPRSRKIRMYQVEGPAELEKEWKKL